MIQIEYGGGLGDVFRQIYENGSYNALEDFEGIAEVHLVTHNPHAGELFRWHRNASRIVVKEHGYWLPEDNATRRAAAGLPPEPIANPGSGVMGGVKFYPSPQDDEVLRILPRTYVVFAISAGETERSFPVMVAAHCLLEVLSWGMSVVLIGRDYARHGRRETFSDLDPELLGGGGQLFNAINRLSVPGVAEVVQGASGVVCAHSSINMLAWLERRPQLLLYPQSVLERHFQKPDLWSFGSDYPECAHGLFRDAKTLLSRFEGILKQDHTPEKS